jgi:hypothetical protein
MNIESLLTNGGKDDRRLLVVKIAVEVLGRPRLVSPITGARDVLK